MAAIKSYRSPKVEVRTSPLAGRGLFAKAPIEPGEIVAIKAGHIVRREEVVQLTRVLGDYSLQIHDDFYLSPRTVAEVEDTVIFINHSCNANVGFEGQVVYVALTNITPGDELCHDYAMARTDEYTMTCLCGTSKCRGTVTGDDWKRADVQAQYGDRFVSYVMAKIRTMNLAED